MKDIFNFFEKPKDPRSFSAIRIMLASFVMFAGLIAGCGGPSKQTQAAQNKNRHDLLRTRAAFDLKCSGDALVISELQKQNNLDGEPAWVSLAGVEGCDQRATYAFDEHRGIWVMNSTGGQPSDSSTEQTRKED